MTNKSHTCIQGFSYAGLENGSLCSCGNDYGMYGPSNDCSTLCLDPYSDMVCGGAKANLIYSTGLSKLKNWILIFKILLWNKWLQKYFKIIWLFYRKLFWHVYLCAGASSLVCPDGWRPFRDSCYMLVGQPKTWSDASSTCVKMSSDLADVVDREENIFLSSLLTDNGKFFFCCFNSACLLMFKTFVLVWMNEISDKNFS